MINTILPILREASDAILEIYSDEDRFQTEVKPDHSPLTAADRRSNEIIIQRLNELYPGIPVISEESKQIAYAMRSGYEKYFLVDPLDGTKEFIKRNGEFTINIAYMEGYHPVGGFVFVPVTGLAYMAVKQEGAFRINGEGEISELRSKPFHLMDKGISVVASRSHRDPLTENIIASLNQPEIVSVGSSLKFLLIADGVAHFYPRFAPTMEWDTAAAQCVLEEAGGSVIHAERLTPLLYNKPELLNSHFIAMGALLDPESLKDMIEGI
ncbi:MAG TPA: 3'(2'),5'-bisphosphate nucleotidase CysQ [Saprospiraceae bacterium]|nr:3'(2'),5'-bisphosphate nucleotidase CysQ [Saprospiraceae bacterium]